LRWNKLAELFYPIPPLNEQRKIVSYVDLKCSQIDFLIADITKEIELLKEYRKSVIYEAVTKGLDPKVEMKDSGIECIGYIPKHWNLVKLKYVSKIRTQKYDTKLGQLEYFGLENISGWNSEFIKTENEYKLEDSIICHSNDVVLGKLRPYLAKVYLVKKLSCCSSQFAVFYDFYGLPNFYKYLFISHGFINDVDSSTYGTKMPRANIDYINNMLVPIPSFSDQEKSISFLDSKCLEIDSVVSEKQQQIDKLTEYKKSLIYEYVTGKKEVLHV